MSRSYKKTPIMGNTKAQSEKVDKKIAHSAERAHARTALATAMDFETVMLTTRKEAHSDVYDYAKDGKRYHPIRVVHEGRTLRELSVPTWLRTSREVRKALSK